MKKFRPLPVPENVHPLVKRLFSEMNEQQCNYEDLVARAGISRYTLSDWRHRTIPNVVNLDAALGALGLRLVIRGIREDLEV